MDRFYVARRERAGLSERSSTNTFQMQHQCAIIDKSIYAKKMHKELAVYITSIEDGTHIVEGTH